MLLSASPSSVSAHACPSSRSQAAKVTKRKTDKAIEIVPKREFMKTPLSSIIPLIFSSLIFATTAAWAAAPKPAGPYFGVFRDLPITDITPQGWLADFLGRQRDGLAHNRQYCGYPFDTCMWTGQWGRT